MGYGLPAVEDELETCTRCAGNGMVNGARCTLCGGRGVNRVPHAIVSLATDDQESDDDSDGLEDLPLTHLRERAELLGLSVDGERDELVARIRAGKEDAPQADAPEGGDDLEDKTVAELREIAADAGLTAEDLKGKRKADLVGVIRAKRAGA